MMKSNRLDIVAGGVAIAVITGAAAAILYRRNHRMYHRKFDVSAVIEKKGKVENVIYSGRDNGEDRGLELLLCSGEEMIPVHLGPVWFMDKQNEKFKKGDKISVRGAKLNYNHEDVIVAQSIKKGDKILYVRNETGNPLWNAWADHKNSMI